MKEMKIIRATFLCVSTMFLLVMTGCSSDNGELTEMSAYKYMEKVKEISNVEGTVHFDSVLSVHYSDSTFWYIKVADPNSQDSIRYDDMFGTLKKQDPTKLSEGKKVLFSGTIWRWIDIESPSIHNTGYNIVVISDINFAQTSDTTPIASNDPGEKVIQYLEGKWNLVRQGEIDYKPSGIFIEIGADKKVACEYGVGLDNYHKTNTEVIEFEDDWTFEANRISGHLHFRFCGENRFLCAIEGDDFNELVLLPDEGNFYFMDPTKYLIRVPVSQN